MNLTLDDLAPWIEEQFDRGGGPGGQNVNKVSTRVTLLFDFAACPLLNDAQKSRIRQRLARRMSADGRLRLVAQSERSQLANRRAAEDRLMELLAAATRAPAVRKATQPTRASQRRRVANKRRRGEVKQQRRRPPGAD
ncbi:MAG: alternative ribosome rescue aminoacyl-tRNA hydrolase ArfB [Phycisphaerae bacterium]